MAQRAAECSTVAAREHNIRNAHVAMLGRSCPEIAEVEINHNVINTCPWCH
eukprot:m.1666511 g.1666511  ORF g.1666511 m.1666511 type:complete len:51 (+) comp145184_c0_seq1:183-335(+)